MKIFEFSRNVIDKIINELKEANKYIRIAIFQLHSPQIFNLLKEKLSEGVKVEIFTLPYDSINEEIRDEVTPFFENLIENGAELHFCKWNVGDPGRTSTAVGRWYSFHGKFIVTDKSAIALSANFTHNKELDAIIIYKNNSVKIEEYNKKFEELIELWIKKTSGYDGKVRQEVINSDLSEILSIFDLPPVIETETHKNNWIQHYPSSLCPDNVPIKDKLYLTPFDCKGRNFIENLLLEASEFAYFSTESFTDPNIANFLKKLKLNGLDLKVISGASSMDFTDRIQNMFRELLAHDIKIKTTNDIHAKLIITDKHIAVTSINLNKMNLGFYKTKKFWRENTESISVIIDRDIILNAKNQYLQVFNSGTDIEDILAEKLEKSVGKMFTGTFGLNSKNEVKKLFSKFIIRNEIKSKKIMIDIGKIIAKLMKSFNRKVVRKNDFVLSLILYYLSERKHDFDQIEEKINELGIKINLSDKLSFLIKNNFIEKVDDYYKINLERMF